MIPLACLFNTGYCSFDKQQGHSCFRSPCGYKTKSDSVRVILVTLDLARVYIFVNLIQNKVAAEGVAFSKSVSK